MSDQTPEKCPYGCGSTLIKPFDEDYEFLLTPEYRCGSHEGVQMPLCKNKILTRQLALANELIRIAEDYRVANISCEPERAKMFGLQFDAKLAAYEATMKGGG